MKYEKYLTLSRKLDNLVERLQVSHPNIRLVENPNSTKLLITEDMDVNMLTQNERVLAHTLLHMFYMNKNGSNLSMKIIERLHNRIVPLLKTHDMFDKLDKNAGK